MNNKILVIGDGMLDHHIYGVTERVSPEAPVPVVLKKREEWAVGAAANVAAHVSAAGVECFLAYKAGPHTQDSEGSRKFVQMCVDRNIYLRPLRFSENCPVTVKTRVWSGGQQVCRIDEEDTSKPDAGIESGWIRQIMSLIRDESINTVVFSDYDKGTLTDVMIMNIADECRRWGIPTILDPKRPTFSRFKNITVAKPNRRELKATNLTAVECSCQMGKTPFLVNTLGEDGMVVYNDGSEMFRCPTVAQEIVDVCGCGDTVTAVIALAFSQGMDIQQAVKAANKGASYTIKHRGCYVLTREEVVECLK